ncbi:MAG: glycerophosphodiester phosphodiesterase [Acidimicrobiales bacterium]
MDNVEHQPRPPRHAALLTPPVGFAHRGARAHAQENTLEAFALAVKLGATGLESDVYVTADESPVLDHDGVVGSVFRRKPISEVQRSELPSHVPSLPELYETVGSDLDLSLDIKDPAAFEATVEAARNAGAEAKLWLCHPSIEQLIQWRTQTTARLVNSPGRVRIEEGLEPRAARLADAGIDALNRPAKDWNAGQVALLHRFGRLALGWDAQQHRQITSVIDMGIDGFFSDHVDRMTECLAQFF